MSQTGCALHSVALLAELGQPPGASLTDWGNETVGAAFRTRAGGGVCVWLLDATKLLVHLAHPRYEGSDPRNPVRGSDVAAG